MEGPRKAWNCSEFMMFDCAVFYLGGGGLGFRLPTCDMLLLVTVVGPNIVG